MKINESWFHTEDWSEIGYNNLQVSKGLRSVVSWIDKHVMYMDCIHFLSFSPSNWHKFQCNHLNLRWMSLYAKDAGGYNCLLLSLIMITITMVEGIFPVSKLHGPTSPTEELKMKTCALKQIIICAEYWIVLPKPYLYHFNICTQLYYIRVPWYLLCDIQQHSMSHFHHVIYCTQVGPYQLTAHRSKHIPNSSLSTYFTSLGRITEYPEYET